METWHVVVVAATAAGAAFAWVLRLQFRAELAEFRISLMRELNGKYMNAREAEAKLEGLEKEIVRTRHDLRNQMHVAIHGGKVAGS